MFCLRHYLSIALMGVVALGSGFNARSAWAENPQTIVLLTSLNFGSYRGIWENYAREFHHKLEDLFRTELTSRISGKNYKIVVKHYAHQDDLWEELHKPENLAVIWVSHAGPGLLVDEYSYDLAPVIREIHPNLRFLALVGCSSEQVIKERLKGLRLSNPDLEIETFDHVVSAAGALKKALKKLDLVLEKPEIQNGFEMKSCPEFQGYPVTITRTIPENETELRHPPVRIEFGKHVLGVLPVGFPGQTQKITVFLTPETANQKLGLLISAGRNPFTKLGEISLGKFEFSAPFEVFSDKKGNPLGVDEWYFDFKGSISQLGEMESYRPFKCSGMPGL